MRGCSLLCEHLLQEPDYDGEVLAFVVGGEEDGVFVVLRHVGRIRFAVA